MHEFLRRLIQITNLYSLRQDFGEKSTTLKSFFIVEIVIYVTMFIIVLFCENDTAFLFSSKHFRFDS